MGPSVAIVGGGVAGATLYHLLRDKGLDAIIYDMTPRYVKPCGEVVPASLLDKLESLGVSGPRVLNDINLFEFHDAENGVIRVYSRRSSIWVSIDKTGWVNSLRNHAKLVVSTIRDPAALTDRHVFVVDARGPFASRGVKIPVWRAYMSKPVDRAIIVFDFTRTGLAWVFPHARKANVGGGFLGVRNPREYSLRLIRRVIGRAEVCCEAYSIVTVHPRLLLAEKHSRVVRVGEAAGFIQSLGGEGIRPAVLSAAALAEAADALDWSVLLERYRRSVKGLMREARLTSLLLRLARMLRGGASRLFRYLPEGFVEAWLEGRLGESYTPLLVLAATPLNMLAGFLARGKWKHYRAYTV